MKKLILIILAILFIVPAFAEYKPIPEELSKKYKAEMEKIINKKYPKAIKKIDNYIRKANKYYNKILKYGCHSDNNMNVINLNLMYEFESGAMLDIYDKLMEVTQEKYLQQTYNGIGTDYSGPFINYLKPYFKDNNVNTKKIDDINNYESEKYKILKAYNKEVSKICP